VKARLFLCGLYSLCLSLCLCVSSVAGGGIAFQAQKPPPVEKITDHIYRVGAALVNTQARTVTCRGEINMDNGAIEYLAVAPRGKLHESLLRLDVRPLHLQVALLLLDLEPKNVLKEQGDRATPQGDPVELFVRWRDKKGAQQEVRAEALISEMPGNKSMPEHRWVFTGSRVVKAGFEADISRSLIAVWHDPAAILDNPLPGGAKNAYVVNEKRTPRRGTAIEFVLKAAPPGPAPGKVGTGAKS
jgi:hypothetical protein